MSKSLTINNILGGVLKLIVGATGAATLGVTGLKSIAFGNVGDNAAGVDIVIAPLVTIRGLILALIWNAIGFSGTVILLANP